MLLHLVFSFLFLITPSLVLAWGDLGYKAISGAVQANLESTTIKGIAKIVGSGDELPAGTLARLSLWPDQLRPFTKNPHATISGFSPEDLEEARDFVRSYPDNPEWHYVDLPLGSSHYPDTSHTDPDDPVLPFSAVLISSKQSQNHRTLPGFRPSHGSSTSWKVFTNPYMSPPAITAPRTAPRPIRWPSPIGLTIQRP
jgi:hypothetical protein